MPRVAEHHVRRDSGGDQDGTIDTQRHDDPSRREHASHCQRKFAVVTKPQHPDPRP
ncbi:MAG: hypothetical protein QM679_01270 [Patulibacter sp.]